MHDLRTVAKRWTDLYRVVSRLGEITVARQIASGTFGSRVKVRDLQANLSVKFGIHDLRIEVKRSREPCQTPENWLAIQETVAIRAHRGDWRFYLHQRTFMPRLAYAAEAAQTIQSYL